VKKNKRNTVVIEKNELQSFLIGYIETLYYNRWEREGFGKIYKGAPDNLVAAFRKCAAVGLEFQLQKFIDAGCDPNMPGVLDGAINTGNTDNIAFLFRHGARVEVTEGKTYAGRLNPHSSFAKQQLVMG